MQSRSELLPTIWELLTVRRTTGARRGHMVIGMAKANTARSARRRSMRIALLACVLAAGCSSTDDASPATTEVAVTAPPSTAEPAVPTTEPAPSTTEAPTTTVAATSTTIDPSVTIDAQVREAVALAQSSFSACLVALPVCDPATLEVARAGDLLARNTTLINEWNSLGYAVRDRDRFRFVVEAVVVDPSLETAVATVCIADGSQLVLPNAAPDGSDVVIDDEYTSGRSEWDMRLDADGVWRVHSSTPVGAAAAEDVCGAP
jgi:hypothetical protein